MAVVFAFLHHVAAFALFAAVVVEFLLLRDRLSLESARKLLRADMVLGLAAAVVFVVGLLRVFYFEKGATYYFHTWTFHAKLGLFILLALMSIVPTLEFLAWRKPVSEGRIPTVSDEKMRRLRAIVHAEMAGVVLILLFAAMMARGVGLSV
jgi:putative membrane protein